MRKEFTVAEDNALLKVLEHYDFAAEFYGEEQVFVTMLYGSQNYGLSTPESDVDTKVMVLPTFKEFVLNKKWTSTEHAVGDGLCNVKDVRAMFENFLKSNINFLETLFSKFVVWNMNYDTYWQDLVEHRDMLANANRRKLMHAAAGMATQKFHALEKPFESKADVLAKYGYDPKQLHHLVRLRYFLQDYLKFEDFGACLTPLPERFDYLMSLKTNPVPLQAARDLATSSMKAVEIFVGTADTLFETEPQTAKDAKEYLDNLASNMVEFYFRKLFK